MSLAVVSGRPLLALALSVTLIFWLGMSVFVLASRAYHDLRAWVARWSPESRIAIGWLGSRPPKAA